MEQLPERGFYQHYKHDPTGAPHNYQYEVTGIARHTESRELLVLYRPLYDSTYLPPADYNARPLDMFMESVEVNGETVRRFTHLTDPALIAELEQERARRYGAA